MENLLDESWQDVREIAIYGFGKAAQENIDSFIDQFDFHGKRPYSHRNKYHIQPVHLRR